jgi:hypothetical protein
VTTSRRHHPGGCPSCRHRHHNHVAFTSNRSASTDLDSGRLRRLALTGMSRWVIRLDLLYRSADRTDPAISAIENTITT